MVLPKVASIEAPDESLLSENPELEKRIKEQQATLGYLGTKYYAPAAISCYASLRKAGPLPIIRIGVLDAFINQYNTLPFVPNDIMKRIYKENQALREIMETSDRVACSLGFSAITFVYGALQAQDEINAFEASYDA